MQHSPAQILGVQLPFCLTPLTQTNLSGLLGSGIPPFTEIYFRAEILGEVV
jgi:hypothetical protein